MRKIEIEIRKTAELNDELIRKINLLKNQHWKHTEEEHLAWFRENIEAEDAHLMIFSEREESLLAYLNFVHVDITINKEPFSVLGIGNVCVNKEIEHLGMGTILMSSANAFIKRTKSCGLILCHDNVKEFYTSSGWNNIQYMKASIKGNAFFQSIMRYDPFAFLPSNVFELTLNRSF